jgi:hypothetical protein
MKCHGFVLHGVVLTVTLFLAAPAFGDLVGGADFVSTRNGANFTYTITLNDDGTTNIGTFWFGWTPGQDYMANKPISVVSPAGWTANITGGTAGDGFAIQWVNNGSAALTPSKSLNFSFTSAETPTQLSGDSQFFAHPPEATAFVYSGVPFSDAGFQVLVSPAAVPEPSSILLAGFAVGGLGLRVWNQRRRK